jgi:acyl carrier protein
MDIYSELGFRSIDAINILLALEDCFEVPIDDVKFSEARSINKLAELIGDANG